MEVAWALPMSTNSRRFDPSQLNGSLLDLLPVFAYVVDLPERSFAHVNAHSASLLGYSADEVCAEGAKFFSQRVHSDDAIRARDGETRVTLAADGETAESDFRIRHQDGRWRWVHRREVVASRDDEGNAAQVLGLLEDITERKLSERHLVRHHERLLQLVAYDIHDGLVQDVVGAQMAVEGIIEELQETDADCIQEVILLRGLLRKAINEGRRMITELRPMIIDEMGVVEALNYLVKEEQAADRLAVIFTHDVTFHRLDPMLEGTLFRIVQESLNNVRRHAKVAEAKVRMKQCESSVVVEIEDSGVGFQAANVGDQHFGLEGIRERARLLRGRATIKSELGKGTLVSVTLPIELPPEWRANSGNR
ncbi:MAG: hypothetical protein CMJ64_01450 [Planctomycetaceae bacterium]|nr:hypothetical protein [Planctomycetaceae bacterium]